MQNFTSEFLSHASEIEIYEKLIMHDTPPLQRLYYSLSAVSGASGSQDMLRSILLNRKDRKAFAPVYNFPLTPSELLEVCTDLNSFVTSIKSGILVKRTYSSDAPPPPISQNAQNLKIITYRNRMNYMFNPKILFLRHLQDVLTEPAFQAMNK